MLLAAAAVVVADLLHLLRRQSEGLQGGVGVGESQTFCNAHRLFRVKWVFNKVTSNNIPGPPGNTTTRTSN